MNRQSRRRAQRSRVMVATWGLMALGACNAEPDSARLGETPWDARDASTPLVGKAACPAGQSRVELRLATDAYGDEDTTWQLTDAQGKVVGSREIGSYGKRQQHTEALCLPAGRYTLRMRDVYPGDGVCARGQGYYEVWVDATKVVSNADCEPWTEHTHIFKVHPRGGQEPCREVRLELTLDKHGKETGWDLIRTDREDGDVTVAAAPIGKYGSKPPGVALTAYEGCLPDGHYKLVVRDSFGDGMCCLEGQGAWRLFVDEELRLEGGVFRSKSEEHRFHFPAETLSPEAKEWLSAHNRMRKKYHEAYGHAYVPLEWDEGLARSSLDYATRAAAGLTNRCVVAHEPGIPYGENAGATTPYTNTTPARMVEGRFVGLELTRTWPGSSHLTNVLWRATRYVGCADAIGTITNSRGVEQKCRISVCRYAKPGNCGIGKYGGQMWYDIPDVWKDDTGCKPDEGPDGHPL